MKQYTIPILILGLALLLVTIVQISTPKSVDWTENYYSTDKRPYGCKVLVEMLPDLFPNQKINKPQTSLHKRKDQVRPGNYLFINNEFALSEADVKVLMNLVEEGSNAFIASPEISAQLENSLGIHSEYTLSTDVSVQVNFTQKSKHAAKPYDFKHINYLYGIYQKDSTASLVPIELGSIVSHTLNTEKEVHIQSDTITNFVAVPWGKGYFFIHSMPQVFSNYNMVHPANVEYIAKALSYLPQKEVFWEDYYTDITYASIPRDEGVEYEDDATGEQLWDESRARPIRKNEQLGESQSMFRFLLAEPPLKWALYLTLLGLVLFVFFEAKRRQRIVPVIKPLANATLDFTQTVGRLYFQYQDHKNIAEKKITYFLEFIRTRYYLSTNKIDAEFYRMLALKTGFSVDEIESMFRFIQYVQKQGMITEDNLLELNRRIQVFTGK